MSEILNKYLPSLVIICSWCKIANGLCKNINEWLYQCFRVYCNVKLFSLDDTSESQANASEENVHGNAGSVQLTYIHVRVSCIRAHTKKQLTYLPYLPAWLQYLVKCHHATDHILSKYRSPSAVERGRGYYLGSRPWSSGTALPILLSGSNSLHSLPYAYHES